MKEECILCGKSVEVKKLEGKSESSVECSTCGNYSYDHFFKNSYKVMSKKERAMASVFTREYFELGRATPKLSNPNELKEKIGEYKKKTIDEKLDNLILYLKKRSKKFGDYVSWDDKKNYPITFSPDHEEAAEIRSQAFKEGLMEKGARGVGLKLTLKGWKKSEELEKKINMGMEKSRRQFLQKLYEFAEGDIDKFCDTSEIGKTLEFTNHLTWKIIRYLEGKNLISYRTDDGATISITTDGSDEVEKSLAKHDELISEKGVDEMSLKKIEIKEFQDILKSFWNLLHPKIIAVSKSRFESGHLSDSVEAAFKTINKTVKDIVQKKTSQEFDGSKLMTKAFSLNKPIIVLDDLSTQTGKNIQVGYMQIFSGVMTGIRNPKAHELITIDIQRTIHLLFLSSLLMFKIDEKKVNHIACHEEVFGAAKSIVTSKGRNEFSPDEVIKYLKKRNTIYKESTIRTHICSRCCKNAPKHHEVKWEYFERIGHGLYKVLDKIKKKYY